MQSVDVTLFHLWFMGKHDIALVFFPFSAGISSLVNLMHISLSQKEFEGPRIWGNVLCDTYCQVSSL